MSVKNYLVVKNDVAVTQRTGLPGPPGPKGEPGGIYVPSIQDGYLVWTNNAGLDNPEPFYLNALISAPVQSVNGQQGNVILDSGDIIYMDTTTVKDALDQALYEEPKILSFTGGGIYEIGTSLSSVTLEWKLNKEIETQEIPESKRSLNPTQRKLDAPGPWKTDTTFTLTVSDGMNTDTATVNLLFKKKCYYGVSADDVLTNEHILALTDYFADDRFQEHVFDCTGSRYIYHVIPEEFCDGILFFVDGVQYSAMTMTRIELKNASGHISSYNVYRSTIQTGNAISVEIK